MKFKVLAISFITSIVLSHVVYGVEIRPKAEQFPDRTIIIGNYAIDLDALNDEIYELASASAKENGQYKIYFKSDINTGTWYDITNSTNIAQISVTEDNIVINSVIDELDLHYYTKKNGETIDFKTGDKVSVSELSDKTDPKNMEEMKELVQELELQKSLKENDAGGEFCDDKIESLTWVLRTIDLSEKKEETKEETEKIADDAEKTEALKALSGQIKTLETTIESMMKSQAEDSVVAIANEQKMALIEKRDSICYDMVYARMDEETKILDYAGCKDLIDKYTKAMSNIKEKQIETGILPQAEEETKEQEAILNVNEQIENELKENLKEALDTGDIKTIKTILNKMDTLEKTKNNDTNVSSEILAEQTKLLEEMKVLSQEIAMRKIEEVSESELYQKALSDGTSASGIDAMRNSMAEEVLSAVKDVIEIDDKLEKRIEDSTKKAGILQETQKFLTQVESKVNYDIKDFIKEDIATLKEENKEKLINAELGTIPVYIDLVESIDNIQKEIDTLYDAYMEQVEKKNVNQAAALKEQLDTLSDVKQEAENIAEKIKEDMKKDILTVNTTTGEFESNQAEISTKEDILNAIGKNNAAIEKGKNIQEKVQNNKNILQTEDTENIDSDMTEQSQKSNEQEVAIYIENEAVSFSLPFYVSGKDVYVPVEEMARLIGANVIKSDINHAIVVKKEGGIIEFIPEDTTIYVNDKRTMVKPAPTAFYGGKVYLPLSAFEKAFGYSETTIENIIFLTKK